MSGKRALVIGGSVGGLFAAHLLLGAGWEVDVFERSAEDLAGRGSGIGTRGALFTLLRRIGIELDPSAGVHIKSRICLDRSGAVTHELAVPAVNSAWDRVYRPLKDRLPPASYHAGARFERLETDAHGVAAGFADGTRVEGDLLIGADGIHSTVRQNVLPEAPPRYAGYVAWRGILDEADLPPDIHAAVFNRFTFGLPEGELIIALPMPGGEAYARPGERRYHWVWFRPIDEAKGLPDLCTDATGQCHGTSIPPPLIRPELVAEVKAHAEDVLAPQLAFAVARTRKLLLQPIFDLISPRIVVGRVALLGDAAFAARPHVGAGVTKAALDALSLADALAEAELEPALARYDRERCAFGNALVVRGRRLGAHLEAQLKPPEARSPEERAHDPVAVLRDYGAAVLTAEELGSAE
ncbi:MAG TPA: FAD-dependent monooxygenase [Stellaceae bacterium]|nr:FAD-dependent monooxygenase [Stellaceae bacterium]